MAAASLPTHILLILCGGTGPRLWPLSRADYPKQFLKLFGPDSLVRQTVKRALKVVPSTQVYVVSNIKYTPLLRQQLKSLIPPDHLLAEPEKKNTSMAILYSMAVIQKEHPSCLITTLPSDHFINPTSLFIKDIKKCYRQALKSQSIVTLAIPASKPDPSYGYFQTKSNADILQVTRFIEKPDVPTATKLIIRGGFWNAGIYTFPPKLLEQEFNHLHPQLFGIYQQLQHSLNHPQKIKKIFNLAPDIAIDRAISEKSSHLSAIVARFNWSDIGEWESLYQQLPHQLSGHSIINPPASLASHLSQNCLVSTANPHKLVALLGVKDLAVIDTPDSLLICHLDQSFEVRQIVTKIVNDPHTSSYFLKSPPNE